MLQAFMRVRDGTLQGNKLQKKNFRFCNMPNAYFCEIIDAILINERHSKKLFIEPRRRKVQKGSRSWHSLNK
jgi:hypothetical protein